MRSSHNQAASLRQKSSRRVNAVGSYGFLNYGDDLFIDTVTRRGGDIWPGAVIRTFAPRKSALYAQDSPLGSLMRLTTATVGLAWGDTIAMCGGSILHDVRGISRWRQKALKWRRVEALGVSVGPFSDTDAEERVSSLINQVDRLVVRDQASAERVTRLASERSQTMVGGDLVALNPSVRPARRRTNTVTICPSAASRIESSVLTSQVMRGLDYVTDATGTRPQVAVLALAATPTANDIPLSRQLAKRLMSRGYEVHLQAHGEGGLHSITQALAESAMVWSQRLHGAIVSYLTDVPFLLVGHHAKCVDFAEDIGLDDRALVNPEADWILAIKALAEAGKPSILSPHEYRLRAESIYVNGGHMPSQSNGQQVIR